MQIEQKDYKFHEILPLKRLLTVDETAWVLGLSPQTLRNAICRRARKPFPIKPKRYGGKVLFDIRDINDFADNLPYAEQNGKQANG